MLKKKEFHQPDYILIISFFILIFIGLLFLSSASYFVACEKFDDCFFHLKHQLLRGLLPGLILFLAFSFFNYQFFKKWSLILFLLTLFLLGMVFLPGIGLAKDQAHRWVDLGIVFQPSELAKLAFVIYLSAWLSKNKDKIKSFKEVFLPFVVFLIIVSVLIILQPDFGTLMVFLSLAMVIYFMAGGRILYISGLIVVAVPAVLYMLQKTSYSWDRITAFLHPELDPSGIGYHITQAILAISSGGILGRGLGYSSQKVSYLPEVISDSIFAVMAEELGFVAILIVIVLYFYMTYRIFRLAALSDQFFGKLLAVGIGFWFIFQTIINMGAMLGIFPLTGIPLPLIGYGGSSFVVFCVAFGILVNISRQINLKKG